ncbi:MAG TPA: hypothetical protein VLA16_15355 [Ideonella sp.]|nr:hypothetical protein [Ideonella sp.]
MRPRRAWLALCSAALLGACGSKPPVPDWQLGARDAMERATGAYLAGDTRIAQAEFARARAELARTGRPELLARAELMRCAGQVASLAFDDCPGFAALAQDAAAPERAYAAYLAGRAQPPDAPLLPEQHRALVAGSGSAEALKGMADPLSRLVAAGVLLRGGRAQPAVAALAVETASEQGWRRPLLAWLNVQVLQAEAAGAADDAARLRRRIALVLQAAAPAPVQGPAASTPAP